MIKYNKYDIFLKFIHWIEQKEKVSNLWDKYKLD